MHFCPFFNYNLNLKEYIQKLNNTAKSTNKHLIPQPLLEAIILSHPEVAEKIIRSYAEAKGKNFHPLTLNINKIFSKQKK